MAGTAEEDGEVAGGAGAGACAGTGAVTEGERWRFEKGDEIGSVEDGGETGEVIDGSTGAGAGAGEDTGTLANGGICTGGV